MLKLIIGCGAIILLAGVASAGTVQCNCPNINAKGTGDTSCSATETGSECTIDFNTFNPADEEAAAELLESNATSSFSWDPMQPGDSLTPEMAFNEMDADQLVDLLTIYMLVSGVQTETGIWDVPVGEIHSELRKQSQEVVSAFAGERYIYRN